MSDLHQLLQEDGAETSRSKQSSTDQESQLQSESVDQTGVVSTDSVALLGKNQDEHTESDVSPTSTSRNSTYIHGSNQDEHTDSANVPPTTLRRTTYVPAFSVGKKGSLISWLFMTAILVMLCIFLSVVIGFWLGGIYARYTAEKFNTFTASNMSITGLGYPDVQIETDVHVWGVPSLVNVDIEPAQVFLYLPTPLSANNGNRRSNIGDFDDSVCVQPKSLDSSQTIWDNARNEDMDTDSRVFGSLYIPRISVRSGQGSVHVVSPMTVTQPKLLTPDFTRDMVDGRRSVCFTSRVSIGIRLMWGTVNLLFDVNVNKRVATRTKEFEHLLPRSLYELLPWLPEPLRMWGLDRPLKWLLDPVVLPKSDTHKSTAQQESGDASVTYTRAMNLQMRQDQVQILQSGESPGDLGILSVRGQTMPTGSKLQVSVHEAMELLGKWNSTVQSGSHWWKENRKSTSKLSNEYISVLFKNEDRTRDVVQLCNISFKTAERLMIGDVKTNFTDSVIDPMRSFLNKMDGEWEDIMETTITSLEWTNENLEWLKHNGTAVGVWTYEERDFTGKIIKGLGAWSKDNAFWVGSVLETSFDTIVKPNWDLITYYVVLAGDFSHKQAESMKSLPEWGNKMGNLIQQLQASESVHCVYDILAALLGAFTTVANDVQGLVDYKIRYLLNHGLEFADFLHGATGSLANLLNTIYDIGQAVLDVNVDVVSHDADTEFKSFFQDPGEVSEGKLNRMMSVWLSDIVNRFLTLWMNFRKIVKKEIMNPVEIRAAQTIISATKAAGIDLEKIIKEEMGSMAAFIFHSLSPESLVKILVWGKSNSAFESCLVKTIERVLDHWNFGSILSRVYQVGRVCVAYVNTIVEQIWKHIPHQEGKVKDQTTTSLAA
eukprot:CFRG0094T1